MGERVDQSNQKCTELYSRRTIDYPYPVAYSVHTAHQGMEYPMICFNGERPNKDGKYSQADINWNGSGRRA